MHLECPALCFSKLFQRAVTVKSTLEPDAFGRSFSFSNELTAQPILEPFRSRPLQIGLAFESVSISRFGIISLAIGTRRLILKGSPRQLSYSAIRTDLQ